MKKEQEKSQYKYLGLTAAVILTVFILEIIAFFASVSLEIFIGGASDSGALGEGPQIMIRCILFFIVFGAWLHMELSGEAESRPSGEDPLLLTGLERLLSVILPILIMILFAGFAASLGAFLSDSRPEMMQSYNHLSVTASFSDIKKAGFQGIISVISTFILLPAAEEIIFRGLIMNYLGLFFKSVFKDSEKAELYIFLAADLLQAIFFAFYQLNIFFGIISFISGLILGLIYKTAGSLLLPAVSHILFNITLLLIPSGYSDYPVQAAVISAVSLAFMAGTLLMYVLRKH